MGQIHKLSYGDDEPSELDQLEANRQTASLGGLVITLFLVVVGLFLVKQLHNITVLEDCLLSGSTTCQAFLMH
jgi:hypothetical protein